MKTEGTNGTSINTMNIVVDENNKIKSAEKGSQIKAYENPSRDFKADCERMGIGYMEIPVYPTLEVEFEDKEV